MSRTRNENVEMEMPRLRLNLDREARREYLLQLERLVELDLREERGMPLVSGQDPITEFLIAMHCLCFGELVDAMINDGRWTDEMTFIILLGAVGYLDETSGEPEKDVVFENPFTHEMMTVMPEGVRGGRIMHMAITMICNDWWVVVGGVRT